MHSQVGSELQQVAEGLPAVSAAQSMLLTAAVVFLISAPWTLRCRVFWSGGGIWVRVIGILLVLILMRNMTIECC